MRQIPPCENLVKIGKIDSPLYSKRIHLDLGKIIATTNRLLYNDSEPKPINVDYQSTVICHFLAFLILAWSESSMELSSTNTNMHENKMLIASKIFAEYGNFIRVIILSQVGNENLADDIFQDFFLSLVYKPIPHNVKNIKSYLYKAITHDIVDAARRVERYKSRMYKYSGQFNYFINNTRPENALIEKEQIDKILKLLKKQLSKSEAQAVSLRYKNDYSIKEVAERMDVDSRTISRYISIGLKKIRQCLMINEVLK